MVMINFYFLLERDNSYREYTHHSLLEELKLINLKVFLKKLQEEKLIIENKKVEDKNRKIVESKEIYNF